MKILTEKNRKWWILIGVSMASFLGCIDFTIVNTALPAIQNSLKTTVTQLQWIINIFILALSTFMVIMGRLVDIYGRRLILYMGMIVFGVASLGAGLATSIELLIIFRSIQGVSCAILYTASGAIVSNAFPLQERGKAIGALFGVNGVGLAIGPVLGGVIVSALSWRWIFLVNVPVIVISLAICLLSVQESRGHEQGTQIDWWGLITLVIALPCLIVAISQGETWGWISMMTIGTFATAAILLIAFFWIETKASVPIIQFHLFTNRLFLISITATFSLALFYCLAFFLMPLYLHYIHHQSDYAVGLSLLPTTAMVALLSPVAGKMVDIYGPKILLIIGFSLFVLSAFLQTQFTANSSLLMILSAFALMGIGWACILGPSTVASLSSVPESMGAVAMGSSWTLHNIGGAIGLGVGVAIYRIFAENALLSDLAKYHAVNGTWIHEVIANSEQAVNLLQQHVSLSNAQISTIFNHFFISGYSMAMWFLLAISLTALLIILFGMKNKRLQH